MAHAAVSLGLAAVVAQGLIAPPAQSDGRRHAQAGPPPSPSIVQVPPQGRQVFGGLFALPEEQRAASSAVSSDVAQAAEMLKRQKREMREPASGPTVVCGMVVVPMAGDPDPGMPRATPPASIHFTIRAVPPPICRD
jgi:hypothetical protein